MLCWFTVIDHLASLLLQLCLIRDIVVIGDSSTSKWHQFTNVMPLKLWLTFVIFIVFQFFSSLWDTMVHMCGTMDLFGIVHSSINCTEFSKPAKFLNNLLLPTGHPLAYICVFWHLWTVIHVFPRVGNGLLCNYVGLPNSVPLIDLWKWIMFSWKLQFCVRYIAEEVHYNIRYAVQDNKWWKKRTTVNNIFSSS